MIFKNASGKRSAVPARAGRIPHPKFLKSILRGARLTPEDAEKFL